MKTNIFLIVFLAINIFTSSPVFAKSLSFSQEMLTQLPWREVSLSQQLKARLKETEKQAFMLPVAGVESSIATYRLPANQGAMKIEIESLVENRHLFVPNVVIFDSQFNVAAHYDSTYFKLEEEQGIKPNRLTATLNLTPVNQNSLYLLIYTTQADLARYTFVPHPSKIFAKATGKQPPAIADIKVTHSLNGRLILNVQSLNTTNFIGLERILGSEKSPSSAAIFNANQTATNSSRTALLSKVEEETEIYFNQAVLNALKQKDIDRALNLINEAEKLGLTTPRKLFLQQVSTK